MDATGNFGVAECKVFVGGVPRDAYHHEVMEALGRWDGVLQIYHKEGSGWATAEFTSRDRRDMVLRNKDRFNRMLNVKVDVREFQDPKDASPAPPPSTASSSSSSSNLAPASSFPAATNLPGHAFMSGAVLDFVERHHATFVVIRVKPPHEARKVLFHPSSLHFCPTHRLMCDVQGCRDYRPLPRPLKEPLRSTLPPGTQVNFFHRSISYREIPFSYQAVQVWPHLSYRPKEEANIDDADDLLFDFMNPAGAPVPSARTSMVANAPVQADKPPPVTADTAGTADPRPFAAGVKEPTPPFSRPEQTEEAFEEEEEQIGRPELPPKVDNSKDVESLQQIYTDLCHRLRSMLAHLPAQVLNNNNLDRSVIDLGQRVLTSAVANLGQPNASAKPVLAIMKFLKENAVSFGSPEVRQLLNQYKSYHEELEGAIKREMKTDPKSCLDEMWLRVKEEEVFGKRKVVCPEFVKPSRTISRPRELRHVSQDFKPPNGDFADGVSLTPNQLNQHMTKWLEENYYPGASSKSVYPFKSDLLVKVVLHTWQAAHRPPMMLKEALRAFLDRPRELLFNWASLIEKTWGRTEADHRAVDVEAVARCTMLYCWDSLTKSAPTMSGLSGGEFVKLLTGVPYSSDHGSFFNQLGVVVHLFDSDFGVVLTPLGRVFLERSVAYLPPLGGQKWRRCDNLQQQLPLGTMVKMNAVKSASTKVMPQSFLFATKAWVAEDVDFEGPPTTGPEVPGGNKYWSGAVAQFRKICQENSELAARQHEENAVSYDQAVEHHLSRRFDPSNRARKPEEADLDTREQISKSYANFLQFCSGKVSSVDQVVDSLKLLRGSGVTFFELRKRFVAASVMGAAPVLFKQQVELWMAAASPSALTTEDSARLVNLAPLLADFFGEADPVAEGQVQEIKKCLKHKVEGSLQFAMELYQKVWRLLSPFETANTASTPAASQTAPPVRASTPVVEPEPDKKEESLEKSSQGKVHSEERPVTPENWFDREGTTGTDETRDEVEEEEEHEDDQVVVVEDDEESGSQEKEDEQDQEVKDEDETTLESHQRPEAAGRGDQGETEAVTKLKSENEDLRRRCNLMEERMVESVRGMRQQVEALESTCDGQSQRLQQLERWKGKVEASLREEIRNLIEQVKVMKVGQAPSSKAGVARRMVRLAEGKGSEVFEMATDEGGELTAERVRAVFPGAEALKYHSRMEGDAAVVRVCNLNSAGDVFEQPDDGWGDRVYLVHKPPQPLQQQLPQQQQPPLLAPPVSAAAAGLMPNSAGIPVQLQPAAAMNLFMRQPTPQMFPGSYPNPAGFK